MKEHHRLGRATHLLLMDDDIALSSDLPERIRAVLGYADQSMCLGGAMFDYHRRTKLFTAGDSMKSSSFGIAHRVPPEGCDVAEATGVDYIGQFHAPDFNGWWCFAFPIQALETAGLPMPCFIRGDDVEYGYRLKHAGYPTIGWPGIAVWHMPFADKSAPWHMFYDRRNSLFANAIHRRLTRWQALRALNGGFIHHLLRYDYERVAAMTRGVEAFNDGPAVMAQWTHHDHARLVERQKPVMVPDAVSGFGPLAMISPERLRGSARIVSMTGRFLKDVLIPWRAERCETLQTGMPWRPDYRRRPAFIVERESLSRTEAYRYSWRKTVSAVLRHICAMAGLLLRFHQEMPHYAFLQSRGD